MHVAGLKLLAQMKLILLCTQVRDLNARKVDCLTALIHQAGLGEWKARNLLIIIHPLNLM